MKISKQNFYEHCYALLKKIPEGKITTYGEIARALNSKAWRAVGTAMAKNQNPIIIPCHRVIRSDGRIGEYAFGQKKKIALLRKEGVVIENGRVKDLKKFMYKFSN